MLLERTWGENPTNSSGEENDSLWEIKGLVWLLLKWGSIKRALKHLQSPAGAAAHFQGTSQGRICCNFVVTRILLDTGKIPNGKGTKVETEERCIQTRDNFFFFKNGSSFYFRKKWECCPSPPAEVFRGFLEMTL